MKAPVKVAAPSLDIQLCLHLHYTYGTLLTQQTFVPFSHKQNVNVDYTLLLTFLINFMLVFLMLHGIASFLGSVGWRDGWVVGDFYCTILSLLLAVILD